MLSRSRTTKRPPKPEEPQRRRPPNKPRKKPSRDLPAVPIDAHGAHPNQRRWLESIKKPQKIEWKMLTTVTSSLPRRSRCSLSYLRLQAELLLPRTLLSFLPRRHLRLSLDRQLDPALQRGESSSRSSGFLSTIKSMSHRSAWTGSSGPTQRPDSGIGHRMVSGPIAMGSASPAGGLLQAASISEPNRASGESSDAPEAAAAARAGATSWSSLVGPNLLSGLSDTERKRQEAIFELISTETAHVRDLQIIVEVFFNSMQSMLSDKASTVIFANIEASFSPPLPTYLISKLGRRRIDCSSLRLAMFWRDICQQ